MFKVLALSIGARTTLHRTYIHLYAIFISDSALRVLGYRGEQTRRCNNQAIRHRQLQTILLQTIILWSVIEKGSQMLL